METIRTMNDAVRKATSRAVMCTLGVLFIAKTVWVAVGGFILWATANMEGFCAMPRMVWAATWPLSFTAPELVPPVAAWAFTWCTP